MTFSAHASVQVPRFKYYPQRVTIVASTADQITFEETGSSPLTGTLAPGTYSWPALAYAAKKALEAAGASTYTVRYNFATKKFTFTSDGSGGGGVLNLTTGGGRDALATFGITSSTSGALTYVSDTATPGQSTLDFTKPLRFPQARWAVDREELSVESGRVEIVSFGEMEEYGFSASHETPAVAQGYGDLVRESQENPWPIEFYPDQTATSEYAEVDLVDREFFPREMVGEGLYRHYEWSIALRVRVPNEGTLDLRALLDRRPSS